MNYETHLVLTCLAFSDRELQIAKNMCRHKISGWRIVIEALVLKNFPATDVNFQMVDWLSLCEHLSNENAYEELQISSGH